MNDELRETCVAPKLSKCPIGEMTCLRPFKCLFVI